MNLSNSERAQNVLRALQARRLQGSLRSIQSLEGVDFCSNDYLGVNALPNFWQPDLLIDWLNTRSSAPFGAKGSRLVCGEHSLYNGIELELAMLLGSSSALLVQSGFIANLCLLEALGQEDTIFLLDQQVHASLVRGARLSKSNVYFFPHHDLNHLERKISRLRVGFPKHALVIVMDAVDSMDGSVAPMNELLTLCEHHECYLILDESHAAGVIGKGLQGLSSESCKSPFLLARTVGLGKAFGSMGGVILAEKDILELVINFGSGLIYSTAFPPLHLAALHALLQQKEKLLAQKTLLNSYQMWAKEILGLPQHQTPIFPIYGERPQLRIWQAKAKESGIAVRKMLSPTVSKNKECLRLVVHSFNSQKDMLNLKNILQDAG